MFPDQVAALQLVKKKVAWCTLGEFHDEEYSGPKHLCPAGDCADGQGHYLRPRTAFVCTRCGFAHLTSRPALHTCADFLGEGGGQA